MEMERFGDPGQLLLLAIQAAMERAPSRDDGSNKTQKFSILEIVVIISHRVSPY